MEMLKTTLEVSIFAIFGPSEKGVKLTKKMKACQKIVDICEAI